MGDDAIKQPIVHLVGSVPLHDSEAVFRALVSAVGSRLQRMPDGETGIRQSWIRFLQDVLARHPALEVADVPPFRFVQWDGRLVREIPRLRVIPHMPIDPAAFDTGYADMAIASWGVFERLQRAGEIPARVRFQICLPTPTAPTYNNMLPEDRAAVLTALTRHFIAEVHDIANALPRERIAIQWDVCQEVLAWEGYYEPGPVEFGQETLDVLAAVGDAVPTEIDLGFHLCYGSPLDAHIVEPRDAKVLVALANAVAARVGRTIEYFHFPVPKQHTDDAYFLPLRHLAIGAATQLYWGLVHYGDAPGNRRRLELARKYARVDGIATECGMGRGDPGRLQGLLAEHLIIAES
jgi:hypothetical protein